MSDAQAKLVLYRSYLGTVQRFHDSSTRALGGYARVVDVVLNGDEVELRIETLHSAEPSGESWVEEEPDECAAHLCESAASDIAAAILPDAAASTAAPAGVLSTVLAVLGQPATILGQPASTVMSASFVLKAGLRRLGESLARSAQEEGGRAAMLRIQERAQRRGAEEARRVRAKYKPGDPDGIAGANRARAKAEEAAQKELAASIARIGLFADTTAAAALLKPVSEVLSRGLDASAVPRVLETLRRRLAAAWHASESSLISRLTSIETTTASLDEALAAPWSDGRAALTRLRDALARLLQRDVDSEWQAACDEALEECRDLAASEPRQIDGRLRALEERLLSLAREACALLPEWKRLRAEERTRENFRALRTDVAAHTRIADGDVEEAAAQLVAEVRAAARAVPELYEQAMDAAIDEVKQNPAHASYSRNLSQLVREKAGILKKCKEARDELAEAAVETAKARLAVWREEAIAAVSAVQRTAREGQAGGGGASSDELRRALRQLPSGAEGSLVQALIASAGDDAAASVSKLVERRVDDLLASFGEALCKGGRHTCVLCGDTGAALGKASVSNFPAGFCGWASGVCDAQACECWGKGKQRAVKLGDVALQPLPAFQFLGLREDASAAAVSKSLRSAMRQHHADRAGGTAAGWAACEEVGRCLRQDAARSAYLEGRGHEYFVKHYGDDPAEQLAKIKKEHESALTEHRARLAGANRAQQSSSIRPEGPRRIEDKTLLPTRLPKTSARQYSIEHEEWVDGKNFPSVRTRVDWASRLTGSMLENGCCYELEVASVLGPRSASPPDSSYVRRYKGLQTHFELSLCDESAAPRTFHLRVRARAADGSFASEWSEPQSVVVSELDQLRDWASEEMLKQLKSLAKRATDAQAAFKQQRFSFAFAKLVDDLQAAVLEANADNFQGSSVLLPGRLLKKKRRLCMVYTRDISAEWHARLGKALADTQELQRAAEAEVAAQKAVARWGHGWRGRADALKESAIRQYSGCVGAGRDDDGVQALRDAAAELDDWRTGIRTGSAPEDVRSPEIRAACVRPASCSHGAHSAVLNYLIKCKRELEARIETVAARRRQEAERQRKEEERRRKAERQREAAESARLRLEEQQREESLAALERSRSKAARRAPQSAAGLTAEQTADGERRRAAALEEIEAMAWQPPGRVEHPKEPKAEATKVEERAVDARGKGKGAKLCSTHRAVLVDSGRAIASGAVSQAAVHAALEEYGCVWLMEQMGSKWVVTFRAASAASSFIASGALVVEGAPRPFKAEHFHVVGKKNSADEDRLRTLLVKMEHPSRLGSMQIEDCREPSAPVAAGTSLDWSIRLTNRGRQPRTLLSVELPYQPADAAVCFSLKGTPQSKGKPVQLSQTFSHTQAVRLVSRPGAAGVFRTRLVFNFSTCVLEHEVAVEVGDAAPPRSLAATAAAAAEARPLPEEARGAPSSAAAATAPVPVPEPVPVEPSHPEELICPLTHELFVDPVTTPYGHAYERKSILEHIRLNGGPAGAPDPLTGRILNESMLTSSFTLRGLADSQRRQPSSAPAARPGASRPPPAGATAAAEPPRPQPEAASSSAPAPAPAQEGLVPKVKRIKDVLELEATLSLPAAIRTANELMGLPATGSLVAQATALLEALGIS